MRQWVVLAVGVAVAAAISAKPLSRLRKPEKNDKLKICLSVAIVLAAAAVAWSRPQRDMKGGAQCTVRPQTGAGYRPYVVPDDLTVGGGPDGAVIEEVAFVPAIPTVESTYAVDAGVPKTTAISAVTGGGSPTDVVVGGTLRLVGDF